MDATLYVFPVPASAYGIPEAVMQRALTKYTLDEETGCHISTYSVASHGYAQIGWTVRGERRGKSRTAGTTAHRAAWAAMNGQIPPGMTIDHTCKNKRCVNPAHLRMLTNYENARRTAGRDWPLGQCVNGHDNSHLGFVDGGRRVKCLICNAESQRRSQQRRLEKRRKSRSVA